MNVLVNDRLSPADIMTAPALPAPENPTGAVVTKLSVKVAKPETSIVIAPPEPTLPSAGPAEILALVATNWPPRIEIAPPLPLPSPKDGSPRVEISVP